MQILGVSSLRWPAVGRLSIHVKGKGFHLLAPLVLANFSTFLRFKVFLVLKILPERRMTVLSLVYGLMVQNKNSCYVKTNCTINVKQHLHYIFNKSDITVCLCISNTSTLKTMLLSVESLTWLLESKFGLEVFFEAQPRCILRVAGLFFSNVVFFFVVDIHHHSPDVSRSQRTWCLVTD